MKAYAKLADPVKKVPEMTEAEKLDILIKHSQHLIKLTEDVIELRGLLDGFTDYVVKNHELIKWLFKLIRGLGEWQVEQDKDGDLQGRFGKYKARVLPYQIHMKQEFDKRLTALEEELEGFRIYTLSTLKEIKEPPIKKKDVI